MVTMREAKTLGRVVQKGMVYTSGKFIPGDEYDFGHLLTGEKRTYFDYLPSN